MEDLENELRRLPEAAAPATLAAGVMARVTRMSECSASPASPASRTAVGGRARGLWAGATALAGVAVVGTAWISGGSELAPAFDPTSPPSDLLNLPSVEVWLAVGVLLYLAGLLASVGKDLPKPWIPGNRV